MAFDVQDMQKLPPGGRFFDLNELWYFPNRWAVRFLFSLPVTANQVTILSLLMGLAAAVFYVSEFSQAMVLGAIFLYGKIFLDNVDGNLARARGEVSRLGRFMDSLTDFMVTALVYGALTYNLVRDSGNSFFWWVGFLALVSCFLHCSYFVFYLVKYTSRVGSYQANRVDERVTDEDEESLARSETSGAEIFLQRLHVWLYGWQDRAIEILDRVSLQLTGRDEIKEKWYEDRLFLSLSSPLCLCTNNMVIIVFTLFGQIEWCFLLIIGAGNVYWAGLQFWKILRHRMA